MPVAMRIKSAAVVKAKKDGLYTITASTPDIDRDGEKILPSAFKSSLPVYLSSNPVILWMHNPLNPPVGKAVDGRIGKTLELDIQFASTPFAQEIKTLVDEGILNTVSIGGAVKDFEIDRDGRRVITDIELYEVSVVTIPSNRQAIIQRAQEAGLNLVKSFVENTADSGAESTEAESMSGPQADGQKMGAQEKMLLLADRYKSKIRSLV
jgi:HK97 family phage prohead protease